VTAAWEGLARRSPPGTVLIGTADHGHIDFPEERKAKLSKEQHVGRILYGVGRALFVEGEGESLATTLPAQWVPLGECRHWWGDGEGTPESEARLPDGVLLADDDVLLLHRFSDDRMIGNHGAMTAAEQRIPLIIGGS